jgi:light-regulated signal transduction histidine kinase (bacteriophytochrome)
MRTLPARVQHQTGRREGTGIGLTIVSMILKTHEIPFCVVSENDANTFWFLVKV